MQYFLLGLAALVLFLLAGRVFASANTATVAQYLRNIGGVSALLGALLMAAMGRFPLAAPLVLVAMMLLGKNLPFSFPSAQKTPGQTTGVRSAFLEMALDHDSGAVMGRVIQGAYRGKNLHDMSLPELLDLLQECREDEQSVQLLMAYLDREHPEWRDMASEGMGAGDSHVGSGASGKMSVSEALDVLGLKPGVGPEDIHKAHREMMKRVHPDHGGSDYLATKINQAKEVLLGK